jgi:hypothetical protein
MEIENPFLELIKKYGKDVQADQIEAMDLLEDRLQEKIDA